MSRITNKNTIFLTILLWSTLLLLTACGEGGLEGEGTVSPGTGPAETPLADEEPTALPMNTATPPPLPTATPQLAALVNGQPILLAEYEQERARYELAQAELGIDLNKNEDDQSDPVLDALIERELIRQAAVVQGITIVPETVDTKMNELRETNSELSGFDDWLVANLWTEEEFQKALEKELIVEKMVAVVTADVPTELEQVRVRYIQVDSGDLAQSLLAQLSEGADFADLAQRYSLDQVTAAYGGDLGFFARGSLLVPEVEAAAFELDLDEVSEIIAVTEPDSLLTTYYIVKLIERDPSRMLGADLRHRLLQEAFDTWLHEQEMEATIVKLLEN